MHLRIAILLGLSGCNLMRADPAAAASSVTGGEQPTEMKPMKPTRYARPTEAELKKRLTPVQYQVTQHEGTEPPFHNAYWDHHEDGLYVDVVTGEPLFSARDKFDSGTGWPSFSKPVAPEHVTTKKDVTLGMVRIEVRSSAGDSHLGHVFDDGPAPGGLRYCINSASLRFIPKAQLQAEGYGEYASLFGSPSPSASSPVHTSEVCAAPPAGETPGCSPTLEVAILAGGCFWGMEEIIRGIPGVVETDVGYSGGSSSHASYEDVKSGRTGHAEAVKVTFDPTRLSYAELLEKWFFRMHDPTTLNRQGNDVGSQYRSAIFAVTPEQEKVAREVIERVSRSGKWKNPITTEVSKAGPFVLGEDYHQDYLQQHPGGYSCHFLRE